MIERLTETTKHRYVSPLNIGVIHVGLGKIDLAFEWLEKTYEERGEQLYWIYAHPRFDPIRSDHRFTDILCRMNFLA